MTTRALDMAEVASLIGEPARANMLAALMDQRASTALELAIAAHVTPPTASAHLGKLVEGGLLQVDRQGRHRYFRLASPQVAQTLESLLALAASRPAPFRRLPRLDPAMRRARTCYDHLAGEIGVAIADHLLTEGHVELDGDAGEVTAAGHTFFAGLGVDLAPSRARKVFCKPCLDWSERRPHLGGQVGAAIAACCFSHGWLARRRGERTLTITPEGRRALPATFGPGLRDLV